MATSKVRTSGVRVEGLRELNSALRALGSGTRVEIKKANLEAAILVGEKARSAAEAQGGSSAKAAASIKAVGSYQYAGLGIGGAGYPFALGNAFGGQGRPTTQQFPPWQRGGYWPFPQIGEESSEITGRYVEAINALISHEFPGIHI